MATPTPRSAPLANYSVNFAEVYSGLSNLEHAPVRAISSELAGTQEAIFAGNVEHGIELRLILGIHRRKLISELFTKLGCARIATLLFAIKKATDLLELACVQPEASALGTFVDLNLVLDAPEVSHQDNVPASRALTPLLSIDLSVVLRLVIQDHLAGCLMRLINTLQLKPIEPYSATASITNINDKVCDGHFD